MGNNTPRLDSYEKKAAYIRNHLFDELRYMLPAATEWSIQHQLNLEISGCEVQVYAMDSTFLRARTLLEFFLNGTGDNYYGVDEFVSTPLQSPDYKGWKGPLHSHIMHAQDRSQPRKLRPADGLRDLNEMPVYFAKEVLRLWEEFEKKLEESGDKEKQRLAQVAREKRIEALQAAECVMKSAVAQQHAACKGQTLKPEFVSKPSSKNT
jgi:hypothetical protein